MRKKFYVLVFVAIIAFTGLTITDSSADHVCGDANSDGVLDVSDAVFLINYIFVSGAAPDPYCCDCPSTVTDYDGNVYQVVEIGDQCWMAENLKVTHYRNGDSIPNVIDEMSWQFLSTGAYSNFENDEGHVATYGRLYNGFAVLDSRNIAPEGWHVPTDEEWKQLEMYLGMTQAQADSIWTRGTDEGGKLKETGTTHWLSPNNGATNESGFTALPGSQRGNHGDFGLIGQDAFFWASTESDANQPWSRGLLYTHAKISRDDKDKRYGFSVRCVMD